MVLMRRGNRSRPNGEEDSGGIASIWGMATRRARSRPQDRINETRQTEDANSNEENDANEPSQNNIEMSNNVPRAGATTGGLNVNTSSEYDDNYDQEDDVTIIELDDNRRGGPDTMNGAGRAWMLQDGQWWDLTQLGSTVNEDRRRSMVRREVLRIQKANFCHFMVLCLVPTSLLLIVLVSALQDQGPCIPTAPGMICEEEERIFVHAFTTRCICSTIALDP